MVRGALLIVPLTIGLLLPIPTLATHQPSSIAGYPPVMKLDDLVAGGMFGRSIQTAIIEQDSVTKVPSLLQAPRLPDRFDLLVIRDWAHSSAPCATLTPSGALPIPGLGSTQDDPNVASFSGTAVIRFLDVPDGAGSYALDVCGELQQVFGMGSNCCDCSTNLNGHPDWWDEEYQITGGNVKKSYFKGAVNQRWYWEDYGVCQFVDVTNLQEHTGVSWEYRGDAEMAAGGPELLTFAMAYRGAHWERQPPPNHRVRFDDYAHPRIFEARQASDEHIIEFVDVQVEGYNKVDCGSAWNPDAVAALALVPTQSWAAYAASVIVGFGAKKHCTVNWKASTIDTDLDGYPDLLMTEIFKESREYQYETEGYYIIQAKAPGIFHLMPGFGINEEAIAASAQGSTTTKKEWTGTFGDMYQTIGLVV